MGLGRWFITEAISKRRSVYSPAGRRGDAASDAMIEQARLTFDDKARNAIYHKFHERVYNDQPYTFLYTSYALIAVSKRFTNVNVYPLGLDLLEWKLAKPAIH